MVALWLSYGFEERRPAPTERQVRRKRAGEQLQFAAATQTVSLYREPCLARVWLVTQSKTLPLQGSVGQGDDSTSADGAH